MKIRKRILSALLALAMTMSLTACSDGEESTKENDSTSVTTTAADSVDDSSAPSDGSVADSEPDVSDDTSDEYDPAFWKVTDAQGNEMYMIGSMHILNDGDYPVPEKIMNAYNECDAVAVECDIVNVSTEDALLMAQYLVYPDGSNIMDHVSDEAYQAMKGLLVEYDLFSAMYVMYNPFMFQSLITNGSAVAAGFTAEGYDAHFINLAMADGKEILEVEGIAYQCDMAFNHGDDVMNAIAQSFVGMTTDELEQGLVEMHDAWRTGELEAYLENYNETVYSEEDTVLTAEEIEILKQYDETILAERNYYMADRAEEMLASGDKVFFIVGAAHYYGEEGLIDILSERGCTFELVE